MLQSKLLRSSDRLNECEVKDSAHVTPGQKGEHVRLIQAAILAADRPVIAQAELVGGVYGPSTAAAVLAYKTKRGIINPAYQTKPDDIVGKMTIKRLDAEMLELQKLGGRDATGGVVRPLRGRPV